MDYTHLRIYSGRYWEIYLHEQQGYIGRIYIWAKRDDFIDIFETTWLEKLELFYLVTRIKKALKKLFKPTLINYTAMGNEAAHCHLHVIPRYQTPVEFDGTTFHDERWGYNYAPYAKRTFTQEQLETIRAALAATLSSL